jgi:hypothetical protein
MPLKRPRFDLFTLIEATAAIALLCALLAGGGTAIHWTARFTALPGDDTALRDWLRNEGFQSVVVEREDEALTVHWWERSLKSRMREPEVPWQKLGYSDPATLRWSYRVTLFSCAIYLWIGGFAFLVLLSQFRKRYLSATPFESEPPP